MSCMSQSQFKNNNVLLPPHLLFEATRLNGPATTSSAPKSWSELAMSESVGSNHDVEAISSESVASNHISDCDHRHQEASSSAKPFLVHGHRSFEADHRPAAPALLLKKHKPSSSSSSNRSYVDRTSLSDDVDDTSASTITTHSRAPMKKKQKLEKGSDLEGFSVCHTRFSTILGPFITRISFGAGLLGSSVYMRMLGSSVDSMADGAKGLLKGAIMQPRLLVPVVLVMIYNRWDEILVPEYGFMHLE